MGVRRIGSVGSHLHGLFNIHVTIMSGIEIERKCAEFKLKQKRSKKNGNQ